MAEEGFYQHDGSYSWIVLVMVILNTFSTYGFMLANVGILSDVYPDLFQENQTRTNIVSSVTVAVFLFSMPFATLTMRVVGCRVIAIAGAVLCLLGMITSAFVSQIWHVVLSYGVCASLGMSFSFTATFGVIPHYFVKRKAAAFAGIGFGTGVGLAAYPSITTAALDKFGYRYGILSLVSVFVSPVVAALLFKPQLPKERIESFRKLMTSYARTWRHFVTAYFLINSALGIGARAAIMVVSFSYVSLHFEPSVAVLMSTVLGISFMVTTLGFTLLALKFKANYFILHLSLSVVLGTALCVVPVINDVIILYVVFAIVGSVAGALFGFKGNLIAHIFPARDASYIFGLTEAAGGIGSFIIPLGAGYIDSAFGHGSGFYFLGGCLVLSSIVLGLAGLIRPKLWQTYKNHTPDSKDLKGVRECRDGQTEKGHGRVTDEANHNKAISDA